MTVLEYLDEWCASLTKLSPAQREAKFFDLLPFDRGRAFNGLVDRFARAEELRNGYLRDLGDTTRACDSLKRELADTQRSLKVADGLTDEVRIRLHEVQSDAVRERANANNLGMSLTKLQLQANGWKEENEQLRKALDAARADAKADALTEADRLRRMLDGRDKRITELANDMVTIQAENEQLRAELSRTQINLADHASGLAAGIKQRDEMEARAKRLGAQLNETVGEIADYKKDKAHTEERLANSRKEVEALVASVRALQGAKEDRETDARLFLELIRAGQDADSVRKAITAYNDIRKNGLTPRSG